MEAIAAAVGLAKLSQYHYFHGKEEILANIHSEFITSLIEKQDVRVSVSTPADQCLLGIMTDIIDLNPIPATCASSTTTSASYFPSGPKRSCAGVIATRSWSRMSWCKTAGV